MGKNSLLETRFYWDVATPLCVCAMQGFFPASSCNRHHMVLSGNIYYLSFPQAWSPARVLGRTNAAPAAPIPYRAPPGSLPKATQTSLRRAPSAARVWTGVAAGRAGTTVWANGATCCECLKHFKKAPGPASPLLRQRRTLRKVQPSGVRSQEGSGPQHSLEKGTNGPTLQNRVPPALCQ